MASCVRRGTLQSVATGGYQLVLLSDEGSVNLTDEQAVRAYQALHGGGNGVAPPPSTSANPGPSGTDDRESDASVAQPSGGASGGAGGAAPLTQSRCAILGSAQYRSCKYAAWMDTGFE
jgi:hypothetical protein